MRVLRCESLPKMDTIGSCDAIVKLAIHPKYTRELEKLKGYKTKTVKSLNPEFPEWVFECLLHLLPILWLKPLCEGSVDEPNYLPKIPKTQTHIFRHQFKQTISLDFSSLTRPKAVCLQLAVWDEDFYGPDDFVGEALIPLEGCYVFVMCLEGFYLCVSESLEGCYLYVRVWFVA